MKYHELREALQAWWDRQNEDENHDLWVDAQYVAVDVALPLGVHEEDEVEAGQRLTVFFFWDEDHESPMTVAGSNVALLEMLSDEEFPVCKMGLVPVPHSMVVSWDHQTLAVRFINVDTTR